MPERTHLLSPLPPQHLPQRTSMEEPQPPQPVSDLYTRLRGISGPALGVSAGNEGMLGNKQRESCITYDFGNSQRGFGEHHVDGISE